MLCCALGALVGGNLLLAWRKSGAARWWAGGALAMAALAGVALIVVLGAPRGARAARLTAALGEMQSHPLCGGSWLPE